MTQEILTALKATTPLKPTIRNGKWVYLPAPACDAAWLRRAAK